LLFVRCSGEDATTPINRVDQLLNRKCVLGLSVLIENIRGNIKRIIHMNSYIKSTFLFFTAENDSW